MFWNNIWKQKDQVFLIFNTMENHLKTSGESLEYKTKENLAANMEMSEQCQQIFQELKLRKKHRYIIYKMGQETFEVDVIGARNEVL